MTTDVDIETNSITISKHGYLNGQKIISTATTSPGGLVDNGIYYVYVVDENNIKLCNEYYESINPIPHIIDITSAYGGTISPINPRISLERNQQVDFDLSDSSLSFANNEVSYSAFDFNLYSDINLNNIFYTSGQNDDFNISNTGNIGIDANAKLTIKNVSEISKDLYYNLIPINEVLNDSVKKEINTIK